jgi:Mg2+/Co2+ transporter CorB
MNVLMVVCRPLAIVMTGLVKFFLTAVGLKIEKRQGSDINELRGAIELYEGPDEQTHERRNMLRSIMDLTDMTVEDVMIHRRHMSCVNFGQPTEIAVKEILSFHHTRIPLWSGTPENIIGVVHVKQVLFALSDMAGDASRVDLLALMARPWFIPNTTTLIDQLQAFRERREHFAIVVDEYGTLMGSMTLEDIIEEIVGSIDDEKDFVAPGVRKLPDGSYQVKGSLSIRDLNRQLGWRLPDDQDYATLAGLVLYESRSVPDVGQSFFFHGYQFDIIKRHRHQVSVIRVLACP